MALTHPGHPRLGSDQWGYLDLARQWRRGDGPSTSAEVSAGYPLFVAGVDLARLAGPVVPGLATALALVQAVLHGATVVAAGVLGRRVATPAVGLLAAGLLAVWPDQLVAPGLPMSETLATLLGVLVVLLLFARPATTATTLAVAGLVLGQAVEVRPATGVLLLLFLVVPGARGAVRARSLAVGATAMLLVMAPFALRSTVAAGAPVPLDLRAGAGLCLGRLPEADGGPVAYERCPVPYGADALEADAARRAEAWRLLRADPGREPALVAGRLRSTLWDDDRWALDEQAQREGRALAPWVADRASGLSTALSRVVVLLALAATVGAALGHRGRLAWSIGAGWLLLAPVVVSLGDPRFRAPSLPFLAVGAAAATVTLAAAVRGRRRPTAAGRPPPP